MLKRREFLLTGGTLLTGTALGLFAGRGSAAAHEYDVGNLKVEHPWLRAPVDGDNKAQFYAMLHNSGATPDKLIAVKSEKFGKAEIHGDPKKLDLITPDRPAAQVESHARAWRRLCDAFGHQEAS